MPSRRAWWLIPVAIAVHNAEGYPKMVENANRYDWRIWSGPAGRRRWRVAIGQSCSSIGHILPSRSIIVVVTNETRPM